MGDKGYSRCPCCGQKVMKCSQDYMYNRFNMVKLCRLLFQLIESDTLASLSTQNMLRCPLLCLLSGQTHLCKYLDQALTIVQMPSFYRISDSSN